MSLSESRGVQMSLSESRGVQMSLSESKESNVVSRSGNSFAAPLP